jgi:hypothetical protein
MFLEDDIICQYVVPKFILTNSGGKWSTKFDIMYKSYGITHQHTTFQWPQCNYGMAECLIKIIKHKITMLSTTLKHVDCWDEQLTKVMLGYCCGILANTRFFPFMILIGQTLRLKANNYLQ